MIIKKFILLFFLLFGGLFPSDFIDIKIWFSQKKEFRNGFEFLQVAIQEKKFILAKLSFNEEKKWEETRVIGLLVEDGKGNLQLKSEMCMVYASKKLGERWILIQTFDCDHLKIKITKKTHDMILSPSIGITENTILKYDDSKAQNGIPAIIISNEKNSFQAWSLGMRYIRKGANAFIRNKPITILETVDSTGTFESKEPFKIGDRILVQNKTQPDFWE